MTIISTKDSWLGVSITANNRISLSNQIEQLQQLKSVLNHRLLIEWRVDFWPDQGISALQQVNQILRHSFSKLPLLLTLRTTSEGGKLALNHADYTQQLALMSQQLDWDVLDVMPAQLVSVQRFRCELELAETQQLIYSRHILRPTDFKTDLTELTNLATIATEQDILKLAVVATQQQNALDLLNATLTTRLKYQQPLITMAMGIEGQITRQLGPLFGSNLSFGSLTTQGSAPGQLPLAQLDQLLVEPSF